MSIPKLSDFKTWAGDLFVNTDWDYNISQIVAMLGGGTYDLNVNTVKADNGFDADGANITNVAPAVSGTDAINLDQANSLLSTAVSYLPYSVASGKVSATGISDFIQKDSDSQITILAGGSNPDLVVVQSDGTVETLTSNVVLSVPATSDTYYIVKEKGEAPIITGATVSEALVLPVSPTNGDYCLIKSSNPLVGYKYSSTEGWEETSFTVLGTVVVSTGTITSYSSASYNQDSRYITSFASNGYTKLPSGLILQWGTTGSIANGTTANITFPIAFPNNCAVVLCSPGSATELSRCLNLQSKSVAGCVLGNPTNSGNATSICWIVIGY